MLNNLTFICLCEEHKAFRVRLINVQWETRRVVNRLLVCLFCYILYSVLYIVCSILFKSNWVCLSMRSWLFEAWFGSVFHIIDCKIFRPSSNKHIYVFFLIFACLYNKQVAIGVMSYRLYRRNKMLMWSQFTGKQVTNLAFLTEDIR